MFDEITSAKISTGWTLATALYNLRKVTCLTESSKIAKEEQPKSTIKPKRSKYIKKPIKLMTVKKRATTKNYF